MGITATLRRYCKQKAVYWAPIGQDPQGRVRLGDPVELAVRWTLVDAVEVTYKGETFLTHANAMLLQDVELGGIMREGAMSDWLSPLPPVESEGGYEIVGFKRVPDRQAKEFYRVAILGRKGGATT
jgi:hypothetical protein